jgi:hydroxyacylglutathione hydrolase
MLNIQSFVFNGFQENTYVLYDETKAAVIIDPGCYEREEQLELEEFIADEGLKPSLLLNTHCHVDHVLGNHFVKERFKVQLWMHKIEEAQLKAVTVYAPAYGLHHYDEAGADKFLSEADEIQFGNQILKVLFVPGHSPGHIAFYNEKNKCLIAGDVLFYNSIGRTDLPGGNYDTLIDSIHKKFFILPDDVIVYPGHGPETTIGYEKKTNPFCALTNV